MNVLEINDAGLTLGNGTQVLAQSPGFAALDGRQLLVGETARARSRLDPRRSQQRFWYQLDGSLGAPLGSARVQADLAFAHLQSLAPASAGMPLLLAVPGSFTRAQLAVLLGLVDAAGLRAEGLVESSVAAASTVETDPRVLHLDVELHRFVLTVLDGGAELSRVRVEEVAKPGLTAVWDALSRLAAQAFLQQTRFDPLHNAATEQSLFDALPGWLQALDAAPVTVLEMASGARHFRASLAREDLVQKLAEPFADIAQAVQSAARPRPCTLLLGARAAVIPGLADHLEHATGLSAVRLDAQAVARGALSRREHIVIPGAGLAHVTRLPGRARAQDPSHLDGQATHILVGEQAWPLPRQDGDAVLRLDRFVAGGEAMLRRIDGVLWLDGPDSADLQLNGRPVRLPHRVARGDRVDCGAKTLRLIEVLP